MQLLCVALFAASMALPLCAQRQSIVVSAATAEGQLIEQIRNESDAAKKVALLEEFLTRYPQHEGVPWAYSEMVATCPQTGQYDKALSAADKLLGLDPGDLGIALAAVKAAEAMKDPDAVRQWAVRASELARREAKAPKAGSETDEDHKQRVAFAGEVDTYTEYALFTSALQAQAPGPRAALLRALEQQAPDSAYWTHAHELYFLALVQTGDVPAAVAVAEKAIAKGQPTLDMLAAAGDFHLRNNTEPQKVLDYSSRLIELVNTSPQPATVSDAAWQQRKNTLVGLGNWMTGMVYTTQGKLSEADKALRAALPLLEGNDQVKAGALFNLGLANQKLNRLADAMRFYEQCVAIQSPYQSLAAGNLKGLKSAYRVVK